MAIPAMSDYASAPRRREWASTVAAQGDGPVRYAGSDAVLRVGDGVARSGRIEREAVEEMLLAPGATRSSGAGRRLVPEDPDPYRTCFERDRDRITHCNPFRRLAGKTQVYVNPKDHQRTRLTHSQEVAQVAVGVAQACRLNVALVEAIALAHDVGHGPGGHASETAFDPYLADGFHHAAWGADITLAPLNLTVEVLDGVRNHSWSRPAPLTPEGAVVRWADRIAYACHDWEDAVAAGIVTMDQLPEEVARPGWAKRDHLHRFIVALIEGTLSSGTVAMEAEAAEALAAFRLANTRLIYERPAAEAQATAVVHLLQGLVDYYIDHPDGIANLNYPVTPGTAEAVRTAVTYVSGMTDRFAFTEAVTLLGWDASRLPRGIDVGY